MNLYSLDRLAARGGAIADRRQPRIVLQYLVVAIHARLTRGHIRIPALLHRAVAIAAIHPELLNVDGMSEGDRLDRRVTDACVLGCEIIPETGGGSGADEEQAHEC